ncbi:MAG: tetratricopeptide repeat protein [Candidatus Omnitrophica bacterium]|nr:tetratricopeptide repeat protein [Candidatus Omnitrophota bacterium]
MFGNKYCRPGVLIFTLAVIFVFALGFEKNFIKSVFAEEKIAVTENPVSSADASKAELIGRFKGAKGDAAINLIREYLVSNPNDTETLNLLANAYVDNGNLNAAQETVAKAIALKSNDPLSVKTSARILALKAMGSPDSITSALEKIDKAIVLNPNDVSLLDMKADLYASTAKLYIAEGNIDKAYEVLDKAISLSSSPRKEEFIAMKREAGKPPVPEIPAVKK